MPVFDFDEGTFASVVLTAPGVFFTRPEEAGTVHFTVPTTAVTGTAHASGPGSSFGTAPLFFNPSSGIGDVFKLSAASTGGGSGFSGTAIDLAFVSMSGTWTIAFTGGTSAVQRVVAPGATALPSAVSGTFTGITFSSSDAFAFIKIASLTADIACFCAGTEIATPRGARVVEDLLPGDQVCTGDGDVARVRWIGRQQVNSDVLHPAKINPIRISAGALGDGLPIRDLCVSPDHAIAIDGLLINAGALVNGSTITQVARMPSKRFTYYHVETDAHELILAEGVAAETYLDVVNIHAFDNEDERAEMAPIREMDLPRISSARLLPEKVRKKLSAGVPTRAA